MIVELPGLGGLRVVVGVGGQEGRVSGAAQPWLDLFLKQNQRKKGEKAWNFKCSPRLGMLRPSLFRSGPKQDPLIARDLTRHFVLLKGLEKPSETEGAWFADEMTKKRDRKPLEISLSFY